MFIYLFFFYHFHIATCIPSFVNETKKSQCRRVYMVEDLVYGLLVCTSRTSSNGLIDYIFLPDIVS